MFCLTILHVTAAKRRVKCNQPIQMLQFSTASLPVKYDLPHCFLLHGERVLGYCAPPNFQAPLRTNKSGFDLLEVHGKRRANSPAQSNSRLGKARNAVPVIADKPISAILSKDLLSKATNYPIRLNPKTVQSPNDGTEKGIARPLSLFWRHKAIILLAVSFWQKQMTKGQ